MALTYTDLSTACRPTGILATPSTREGCTLLDDGSYGPIVETAYVRLVLRDARQGTTIVRELPGLDVLTPETLTSAIAEMRAEAQARASDTRRRTASWARVNRS
jgi:hypothetical protein